MIPLAFLNCLAIGLWHTSGPHLAFSVRTYRFEQLLPLGSLVFKEESGYWGYYYHLFQPYEHYVPL